MSVSVRVAGPGDLDALLDLEGVAFGAEAWSQETLRATLGPGAAVTRVAVEGVELVGYAVLVPAGEVRDLQRVGVRTGWRRQGIAGRLLSACLEGETVPVLLEVAESNQAALALYAAHGFAEISRRRRYYRDGSDAVVLRRIPLRGTGPAQ